MEQLKEFIKEHDLCIDISKIKSKFICKMCNWIIDDAVTSKCLCNFCRKCIGSYITENDRNGKQCPNCYKSKEEVIILTCNDVSSNFKLSSQIEKLSFKCLWEGCEEEIGLMRLLDHLLRCAYEVLSKS